MINRVIEFSLKQRLLIITMMNKEYVKIIQATEPLRCFRN